MDRIEKRVAFDKIRYANCWEDAEILCKALEPEAGKRILSIGSAGDNSLSLLAAGAKVVAVDLNPSQIACIELRKVGIKNLDYEEFLGFLGIKEIGNRLDLFDKIKGDLSSKSLAFWNVNKGLIRMGFVHYGKFELYFQLFRKRILAIIHSRKTVEKMLEEKSLEERLKYYDAKWDNFRWRLLFKIFFSRYVMGKMGRDPEFFRYVDTPVSVRILSRAKYALSELPTHNNPYLAYILTGNFTTSLPHYLQPDNFFKIRENLDNLVLFEGTIQDAAEKFGDCRFDGFNLSDIFEYLDVPTCKIIFEKLLAKSRGKARFVYWNMLAPRILSEHFDQVQYLESFSKKLFASDKAFFYSNFIVEEKV